jgi:tetratricopeptide (TPR) repeat protein
MKMKSLVVILAIMAALVAVPAWGQRMSTVKGTALDWDGKPMVGAVLELKDIDNGRTISMKTDAKGEFYSLAVYAGTYNVSMSADGKVVYKLAKYQVGSSEEYNLKIDLRQERAAAEKTMSAEDKAKQAKSQQIKGVNKMMADATTAMNTKNYEEAVRIMTEASQTAPTFYQVWGKLAECNMAYGRSLATTDRAKATEQYQAAVTAYQKAAELQPTDGSYNNNMADALGRLGKSQEALDQVKLALEKNPLDPKFHFNMGAILTNMGKSEDAVAAFDKAIAADPTYAEAYYQKGVNLMGRAKLDTKTGTMSAPPEVAESFNKYLELAPTGANAEGAKQLLASIGAKVETSFGKKSTPAKKR